MKNRVIVGLGALALAVVVAVSFFALILGVLDQLAFRWLADAETAGAASPAAARGGRRESLAEEAARLESRRRELEKRLRELQRERGREWGRGLTWDGGYAEVYSRGEEVDLATANSRVLALAVLKLAKGSFFAERSAAPAAASGLHIKVRYEPPLSLLLPTPAYGTAAVREFTLVSTAADEDGWPSLFASSDFASWDLGQCKGPIVVEMLCLQDLAPHVAPAVASKCDPRRRGRGL